jgi:hypothetical protein
MKAYQLTVLLGDNCPSAGSCLYLTGPLYEYSTSVVVLREFIADMSVDCKPSQVNKHSIDTIKGMPPDLARYHVWEMYMYRVRRYCMEQSSFSARRSACKRAPEVHMLDLGPRVYIPYRIRGSFDQGEQEDSGRTKFRFVLIRFIASKNSIDQ